MIDRVRLSASARQQLITLKRRTGLQHYNVICRHALCESLANSTVAPIETLQFADGLEIDWSVFCGGESETYTNMLTVRALADGIEMSEGSIRQLLTTHVHRGLSFLSSNQNSLIPAKAD